MQHSSGIAILAVRLADVDRRALSQAWYSALHVAGHGEPRRGGPRAVRTSGAACAPGAAARCETDRARRAVVVPAPRHTPARGEALAGSAPERRAPKCELTQRIERGLARGVPRRSATFDVRALDGRVHVVVQSDGRATRVVAVCAPALRERVERALAQARFVLAGRGARTEAA